VNQLNDLYYGVPKAAMTYSNASTPSSRPLKVAIVHDWFVTYAGAERVVEQLLNVCPQADLFALVDFLPDRERTFLGGRPVRTSFIQDLPKARKSFRNYLMLMPLAVEQFDFSIYDLVISSSHAVAKGVITGPHQWHISYVHTPMRYAWELQNEYLAGTGLDTGLKGWAAKLCLHYMRIWDTRTANGVDTFVANSDFVARRIRKVYGRDSTVIYPPVDISHFPMRRSKEPFYLAASRMVPYKRMPMIAEAFSAMRDRTLLIMGDGPEFECVKRLAARAPNICVMGYQSADILAEYMGRARALVFAAEEDFGITPLEAQACGTPVIAYGSGGVLETIISAGAREHRTGMFYEHQTPAGICEGVRAFESAGEFKPEDCRANAERFSVETFRRRIDGVIWGASARSPRVEDMAPQLHDRGEGNPLREQQESGRFR
jgi:glycosyltransferase involved in cell wall biosynthesis